MLVENFVVNKAISRQYHTWFAWTGSNANQFFALFGPDFKQTMINKIKKSDQLQNSIRAFLELGGERNKLVHQNYAVFQLEKTLDEIYQLYQSANEFVETIYHELSACDDALWLKSLYA
jgi:hypothetical protein